MLNLYFSNVFIDFFGVLCGSLGFLKIIGVGIFISGCVIRYYFFGGFIGVSILLMFLVNVVCFWIKIGIFVFSVSFIFVSLFMFSLYC